MNKRQRMFLRAIGFLIIILTFIFSYQYYFLSSEQKAQIGLIDKACNLEYNSIKMGEIGQALLNQYSSCDKAERAVFILNWSWIGYIIGLALMIFGIWHGLGAIKEK